MLTITSHALGACHQSAAREGLCLTNDTTAIPARPYTTFYHNVSSDALAHASNIKGVLNWPLSLNNGSNMIIASSAMAFSYRFDTNLVDMGFTSGSSGYQTVSFEEGSGSMYIEVFIDDTDKAPVLRDPPIKARNWYLCPMGLGSSLQSLHWKIGLAGEPQNPNCSKVEVQRVWA
jgi:hypothetical protein